MFELLFLMAIVLIVVSQFLKKPKYENKAKQNLCVCEIYNKDGKLLLRAPNTIALRNYLTKRGLKKGEYSLHWIIK